MRKTLTLLAAVAALAMAAVATAAERVIDIAAHTCRACAGFLINVLKSTFCGPVDLAAAVAVAPQRPLLQARSFVLRLLKRERPVLTASWRMCPST